MTDNGARTGTTRAQHAARLENIALGELTRSLKAITRHIDPNDVAERNRWIDYSLRRAIRKLAEAAVWRDGPAPTLGERRVIRWPRGDSL